MKLFAQNVLFTVILLVAVNSLISCAPNWRSLGPYKSPNPDSLEAPRPPGEPEASGGRRGTSDTGGGTGLQGRVFESYIVDPTQLPAYKQIVEPLLKNIKSLEPDEPHFGEIVKMKTWYIAPIDLDKVSKDALGIVFVKSDTQQIARQSMKEVWIDKRIFDSMSLNDQADLILHEIVMGIYFMKFMRLTEICKLNFLIQGDKADDCSDGATIDKNLPPEQARPLNDTDNENIRFVTGWIKQNAKNEIPEIEFIKILALKGFDRRLFNPANYRPQDSNNPADIKISKKELWEALKGAELSGNMPDVCHQLTGGKKKSCKIEFVEKTLSFWGNSNFPGYNLRIKVENEPTVSMDFVIGEEINLFAFQDTPDSLVYSYPLVEQRAKFMVGDRTQIAWLTLKKEGLGSHATLALESVLYRPGIIVSIDKNRNPVCLLREPRVINFFDDAIAIRRSDNSPPGLVEQSFLSSPPVALCNDLNVEE